jgi:hypothetical protein
MAILRITQTDRGQNQYRVELAVEGDGRPRYTATSHFQFALSPQQQENLRWYLEDFLQYELELEAKKGEQIEQQMAEIGLQLFRDVFHSSEDARDLWATLRDRINDTRIEIVTEVSEAATIPWELIRDPKTDTPLALRASTFVRTHPTAGQRPKVPQTPSGPVRILLIICRTGGRQDEKFGSVANHLIKVFDENAARAVQLDVLRPPTFEQLGRVLRSAKAKGQPYHIVHFDGHGVYAEMVEPGASANIVYKLSPLVLSGLRTGAHGYLLFENPAIPENTQMVDGSTLGNLLVETDVPVLVLNACRSAHAEPPSVSVTVGEEPQPKLPDPHASVRAFGSLAQEVMDNGVAAVVAMRYNVYVNTAAQFVGDLYTQLTQGLTLGEAVTLGRKQLRDQPLRAIASDPYPLQDWSVPVVYEAAPIPLFSKPSGKPKIFVANTVPGRGKLDTDLPPRPDTGFFGRDETLLSLDRTFDNQSIVLLNGDAGSGKTATAAEFARWYAQTGGVVGWVLFTSFAQHLPLTRVLDKLGQAFADTLEELEVQWQNLRNTQQRDVALQLLKQVPVIWIWDNLETVAGLTNTRESLWSPEEQLELVNFLRAARDTKAKFLLASRNDEREWLGELPARLTMLPMPMQERVLLARAIAQKQGQRLNPIQNWQRLLELTRGNPATLIEWVGQAVRDGLKTKEEIEGFIAQLCKGNNNLDDSFEEEIITLAKEVDAANLVKPNQVVQSIQEHLQPNLALFDDCRDSERRHKLDDSDLEKLADLLKRSGRLGSLSSRRALCIQIKIHPDDLDFLEQTAPRDFAQQLIFYLKETGDYEAILRVCIAMKPILKGGYKNDLENIKSKIIGMNNDRNT